MACAVTTVFVTRPKASATPTCWLAPASLDAVVFVAWSSFASVARWSLARCLLKFEVLPRIAGTFLAHILHTASSRLAGSPCSFGTKPKYAQTGEVVFDFPTNSAIFLLTGTGKERESEKRARVSSRSLRQTLFIKHV